MVVFAMKQLGGIAVQKVDYSLTAERTTRWWGEGDKEDFMYIVLEGRIAIEMYIPGRGRMRVFTAETMDIVGWSSVTPVVRQRTASARAILPSRLIKIDTPKLLLMCEEDHDLGYFVMRRLANVVSGAHRADGAVLANEVVQVAAIDELDAAVSQCVSDLLGGHRRDRVGVQIKQIGARCGQRVFRLGAGT